MNKEKKRIYNEKWRKENKDWIKLYKKRYYKEKKYMWIDLREYYRQEKDDLFKRGLITKNRYKEYFEYKREIKRIWNDLSEEQQLKLINIRAKELLNQNETKRT